MAESSHVSDFSAVDRAPDPGFAIRFMELTRTQPGLLACKEEVLEELRLGPGSSALDAGCGLGADAADMAAHVAPGGTVVGLDRSETMIAAARARHAGPGLTFEVGDLTSLPFPDASFDGCRADTVLQHVPDHAAGLAEMTRVVRPGGRVAGLEMDMDTFIVDSPDRALTRAVVTSASDSIAQGWAGRQLARMYRAAGLADVTVRPRAVLSTFAICEMAFQPHVSRLCAAGALDPEQAERWWADLREAEAAGRFLSAFTVFVVAGTKPGRRAGTGPA